jgi:hypothetical protein
MATYFACLRQWEARAEECFRLRSRPSDQEIMAGFGGSDRDTGEWLISKVSFGFSAFESRVLSTAFFFLKNAQIDYFLLSFLRGNLESFQEADVAVRIAAEYLEKNYVDLAMRFSAEELQLISEYFELIKASRGHCLDAEFRAAQNVSLALDSSPNDDPSPDKPNEQNPRDSDGS